MTAKCLIIINVTVYVALKLLWLASAAWGWDFTQAVDALALPSTAGELFRQPWTLFTYMFTQLDFWHLLVNMLWLGWFGTLYREGKQPGRLAAVYIAGGIAGALGFIAASYLSSASSLPASPATATLVGASAATLAVIAATTFRCPDLPVRLLFYFEVKLKWLAPISLLTLLLPPENGTASCMAAHAAGLLSGLFIGYAERRIRYNRMRDAMTAENASTSRLIEKARRNGFGSLSAEERRTLFDLTAREHGREAGR